MRVVSVLLVLERPEDRRDSFRIRLVTASFQYSVAPVRPSPLVLVSKSGYPF